MKKNKERMNQKTRLDEIEIDTEIAVEERQEKRKGRRTSRRRRFFTFLIVLLLLIASISGVIYAHTHNMLNIEKIEVSGNSYYDTMGIVEMSGAVTGEPILTADTKPMKKALLQAPYIKTAKVSKRIPHTLKITVVERQEAYAVSLAGSYILIDIEKYALRKVNDCEEYIIIEGFVPESVTIGEPYQVENQAYFDDVIKLATAMSEYNIEVKKISFKEGLVKTYFSDKLMCETTVENFMKYLVELKEILLDLELKGIERGTIHIGDRAYFSYSPIIE